MSDPKKNLETLRKLDRIGSQDLRYRAGPSRHLDAIGQRLVWLTRKRHALIAADAPRSYLDDEINATHWLLACIHVASGQDPTQRIRTLDGGDEIDYRVYDAALRSLRQKQRRAAA